MAQLYTLLRNNQTYGPLALKQLINYQLTPADLVWQEGISHAWSSPATVHELAAYVSGTSMVEYNFTPYNAGEEEVVLEVKYSRSLDELKEAYNQWQAKTQRGSIWLTLRQKLSFLFV